MAKEKQVKGVGGWLGFFVFTLFLSIILNFVLGIVDIVLILDYSFYLPSLYVYAMVFLDILYFGGIIAFTIYVIYLLIKKKQNAVPAAILFISMIILTNIISWILSGVSGYGSTFELLSSSSGLIRSFIYGAIWISYLRLSKRVENTYPKDGKLELPEKIMFMVIISLLIVLSLASLFSF